MSAAAPTSSLIAFENVSKSFGPARPVLVNVDLSIERGEFVVLAGAGGAGKSTLLRLILGLEAPDRGVVRVGGIATTRLRSKRQALLRRSIGVVPQDLLLLNDRTVLANVMLPALAAGASQREAKARARAALQRVDVAELDFSPLQLAGSAQQRVALARAIVNRPTLIIADEPTAHLDQEQAADVVATLEDFAAAGVAVILASHGEPMPLSPKVRRLTLRAGRLS